MHITLLMNSIAKFFRMPVIAWSPNLNREPAKEPEIGLAETR